MEPNESDRATIRRRAPHNGHGGDVRVSDSRCGAHLRAEIEEVERPATLDPDEVDVVDIDGIRFLNECKSLGIQVVNCSPYIREWMLQEKRTGEDEE